MLNQSLQQVNSELDNFIYKTSHDIRGPLATLKGMCTLAIMEIHDPLSLDYIKKIDFTAERLNTILTRLMIVNQINYSALIPAPVDFKYIFDETLALERKKGLPENFIYSTEIDPEVVLISDYNLVRIVLENLIDNAVKFYNESSSVTPFVRITISKIPGYVTARVEDNGIGINHHDKSKVFQMFTRASERSQTGGVGLYLSKLATEKLGGEIILEDTSEKGTSFFVKFPEDLNIVIAKRAEEERQRELQRQAKAQASNATKNLPAS
jgi:signal transduction histidine kinase